MALQVAKARSCLTWLVPSTPMTGIVMAFSPLQTKTPGFVLPPMGRARQWQQDLPSAHKECTKGAGPQPQRQPCAWELTASNHEWAKRTVALSRASYCFTIGWGQSGRLAQRCPSWKQRLQQLPAHHWLMHHRSTE